MLGIKYVLGCIDFLANSPSTTRHDIKWNYYYIRIISPYPYPTYHPTLSYPTLGIWLCLSSRERERERERLGERERERDREREIYIYIEREREREREK